jgi:N-acetyl-anhydromuramyl-L-alanine amidase AmpD
MKEGDDETAEIASKGYCQINPSVRTTPVTLFPWKKGK